MQFELFDEDVCVTTAHSDQAALLGARVVAFAAYPVGWILNYIDLLVSRDNIYGTPERAMQVMRRTAVLRALGIVDALGGVELELEYPDGMRRRLAVPAVLRLARRSEGLAPDGWTAYHTTLPGVPTAVSARLRGVALVRVPGRQRSRLLPVQPPVHGPRESLSVFLDRLFALADRGARRLQHVADEH